MTDQYDRDDVRRESVTDCLALLQLAELEVEALLARAVEVLGDARAVRCAQLAQLAPLTGRVDATGAIAQLVVGTHRLGRSWWTRNHQELCGGTWHDRGIPDALLDADPDPDRPSRLGSCLDTLGYWISDAAADDEWGRPVDDIDANDQSPVDRVRLPLDAAPGDRLVVSFDPGGRVWADVVDRSAEPRPDEVQRGTRRGTIGTWLDADSFTHCATAHIWWAWCTALEGAALHLPGDAGDSWARPLDPAAVRTLHAWAQRSAVVDESVAPWRTAGELNETLHRLGFPGRAGHTWRWWLAAHALINGDLDAFSEQVRPPRRKY